MKSSFPSERAVAVCIDTRDGQGRKRLYGVIQYARRHAWRVMLVRRSGAEAAREVVKLQPDGILAYLADPEFIEVASRLSVPLVDTAHGHEASPFYTTLDNEAVGRLAVEHFAGLGLKDYGYCGVRGRFASTCRQAGYGEYLARRGERLHAYSQSVAEGELRMEPLMRWLDRLPKPIGILAFEDKLGERVLTACRWAGLSVPDQIAVLGVGNDELMCEVSWPTLSSIHIPTQLFGLEAAAMLDRAMNGQPVDQPHRTIQPLGIVVRGSTDILFTHDGLVKEAVAMICQRVGDPIGVEHLARALNVSRRTLDRRFLNALGRSVHHELAAARMQRAQSLLADSERTISEIAEQCGFGTAASFSHAFHECHGCWPSEVRKNIRVL